jgi:hypothetical protein
MIGATLSDRAAVSSDGIKVEAVTVSGLNRIAARLRLGKISESSSRYLPPSEAAEIMP